MDTKPVSSQSDITADSEQHLLIVLCSINASPENHIAEFGLKHAHVVHLEADGDNLGDLYIKNGIQLLEQVQTLADLPRARLQLVVPVDGQQSVLQGLGALLRTAALEHPNMTLQTIAVESDINAATLASYLAKEATNRDTQVRYHNQERSIQVLEEVPAEQAHSVQSPWRNDGIYLISGGAGGLGRILAKAITMTAPDAKLLLLGRRKLSPSELDNIEAIGRNVSYHAVDISDLSQLCNLVSEQGPITTVIHCAGQLRDSLLKNKTTADLAAVLTPKVTGTLALDRATLDQPLDAFILFSSTSSVFGNPGQADYALANGFLDSFSELRNKWLSTGERHGHTLSINWPFWSDGGMEMPADVLERLKRLLGMTPLDTTSGLATLNQSLAMNVDRTIVLSGEQDTLRANYITTPKTMQSAAPRRAASGNAEARLAQTRHVLVELLCDRLKLSASQVEGSIPFDQYGLDSVSGTELASTLEQHFGTLPKTVFFEHPTLDELAAYLADCNTVDIITQPVDEPSLATPSTAATTSIPTPRQAISRPHDIAIIGHSGRYPSANDLTTFWNNLASGIDSIDEVPDDRWPANQYYDGSAQQTDKSRGKWGAFIDDIESFDPLLFGISPKDATLMNPQERLFLQIVWSLLEDGGYNRKRIRVQHNGQAGVYVGAMYQQSRAGDMAHATATSIFSKSILANRVSHFFDLEGPSVAVDTMCSSATMAIHLACKDLRQGECELAIAGGVNLNTDPKKFIGLSHLQLLASSPNSRSFSDGDGYLPADSVGAVLLKPLAKAIEDGDRIHAVIKGSATSHGGHGIGYMAPSTKAQQRAITQSLERAGVSASEISYVEAAANGSPLGDALEVSTLNKVFRGSPEIAVGTVKSNLGHPEAASGMPQISKVILQLRHAKLAPTIKINQLNPKIDLEGSSVKLQQELADWPTPPGEPRRALINSFGAGGSCVSLVIEEYIRHESENLNPASPQVIVLSAQTLDRLAEYSRRMISHLESNPQTNLTNVAYTLQTGREALAIRLAFVASTSEQLLHGLREALAAIVDNRIAKPPVTVVNSIETRSHILPLFSAQSSVDFVHSLAERGDLERIALYWAQGGDLDWSVIQSPQARLTDLPGYPFELRRFPLPPLEGSATSQEPVPEPAHTTHTDKPVDPQEHITSFLLRELALTSNDIQAGRSLREYGLESVSAMALLRSLNQTFALQVEGRALLEHPTVESLAQYVQRKCTETYPPSHAGNTSSKSSKKPIIANSFPLSEGQKGLWLLQKRNPTLAAYNVPICIRLATPVDITLLRDALHQLSLEQPLLTCTIDNARGALAHTLHLDTPPVVKELDLRGMGEAAIFELLSNEAKAPIDLESGPLVKTFLSRADGGDILLIILHHLIFDGRSVPLLLGRLLEVYMALDAGTQAPENRLAASYADFVDWESNMLASDQGRKHQDYWHQQLQLPIPCLELPTDRPRPDHGTTQGRTVSYSLSSETHTSVRSLAAKLDLTPAVLFLSIYLILLHQRSGKRDIVVGMPTVGRPEDRFDKVVGYFVNMIAVRARLTGAQSVLEYMRDVQKTVADGLDHSAYPFPKLVSELCPPRVKGHAPIFQVAFEYQSESVFAWQPEDRDTPAAQLASSLEYISEIRQEGEFELALEIQSYGDDTQLHLKYAPEIYNHERIEALMSDFCKLLDLCIGDPQLQLNDLPTAGSEANWPDTAPQKPIYAPYPNTSCIHHLISKQSVRTPDAPAVRYLDTSLTYSELEQRSDTLALALVANGLTEQQRVGVCVSRSLDMIVALLGVMKAGAIYVPLDPDYPDERLRYMIKDSGCTLVLTQSPREPQLRQLLPDNVTSICLDRDWPDLATAASSVDGLPTTSSRSLAYIIYTSGSTGNPKGVMVEHHSIVNLLYSMREEPGFKPGERLLALATYSFDIAVVELFLPLIMGGECCLCDSETLRDGGQLKAEIERLRPNYIQATPMTWMMLLRSGWRNPGNIRMVTTGEALPTVLRDQFVEHDMPVWNMYGPTETTVYATCWRVNSNTPVLIGRPLNNTRAYILDDAGNPVAAGTPGELYLGGDGVARGYWQKEDLTQQRFIDRSLNGGERMYKTGDLARWHESGQLEYLGRLDDQVKIRGYRIELGEIETQLAGHPHIAQCSVTAEKLHDSPILVAHYVPEQDALDESTLRDYLRTLLPSYMVPTRYRSLRTLPQTPSGKVDKRALTNATNDTSAAKAPSESSVESKILSLWRSFFDNPKLGPDDSFFDVGGDSMMAQSMTHTMQQELGISLTAGVLFTFDTARTLASAVEQQPNQAVAVSAPQQALNLHAEAVLDADIIPDAPAAPCKPPQNVLLTGATGFLGAHLLAELLERTEAQIHCLVRADNRSNAEQRLADTLSHYGLWKDWMRARLAPLPGRLDRPCLGLDQNTFDSLAKNLDAIYHNGALINQSYPYLLLKPSNVEGTAEVLRLACRGKATPVHHISTISVQDFSSPEIDEELMVPHHKHLQGGYIQSKWVAEQLICIAHQRGLPVTIYRPSRIVGHADHGIMNTQDLFCRMIKSVVTLGTVPDSGFYDNIIAVNDASRFIVNASLHDGIHGRALHVMNPAWYHSDQLNEFIRQEGYDIERVSVESWLQQLEQRATEDPSHPLASLVPMFRAHNHNSDADPLASSAPIMATRHTDAITNSCPRIPHGRLDDMLRTYFDYFYATGFLAQAEPENAPGRS